MICMRGVCDEIYKQIIVAFEISEDKSKTDRVLNSRTIYLLTGIRIPYAADLYNDALTISIVIQSLSYDALLLLVFTLIYMIGVKWRAIYG